MKTQNWKGLGLSLGLAIGLQSGCSVDDDPSEGLSSNSAASSSSVSSENGGCDGVGTGNGYCLVWQDEFQASSLDLSKWSYEKNCYGGGNNEAQCYVDNAQNVWVDGEYLHLKAIREATQGPNTADDDPAYDPLDVSGSGDYSSGRIRSKGKGDWRYGRFEIRAKLPSGQGTWPAIWMLPTDWIYGGWASSGEIDIMEAVNLKVGGEARVHGTLHYGDAWPDNVYTGVEYVLPNGANPADDFHEYAIEWEEGEIRWYVDGDHFATQTQAGWYTTAALDVPAAPYNQTFHLILNLAVGGDWAANVNDTGINPDVFPQELIVDYVRVYECIKDPNTGKGCASSDGDFEHHPGTPPPNPVEVVEGSDLVIFDDSIRAPFEWFYWAESGSVGFDLVQVGEGYGNVAQFSFNSDTAIAYFQSEATDLSGFSAIEFDMRVVNDPRSDKSALILRADCTYPCTSGDYPIAYPGANQWRHYRVDLAELASAGLDLQQVNTPFVISPTQGNQNGVVLQVDNVVVTR